MGRLDLSGVRNEDVNALIARELEKDKTLTLTNVNSMHNVCAGLRGDFAVTVEDSTGLYTASYMDGPCVTVKGNAGWYAGDDMVSGSLVIEKNTGCNIGAYICGGDIVVRGGTGSRVGYGMKGGNIIICGDAGRWAGQLAMGGNLIILGAADGAAGESMYGGVVFTADGDIEEKLGSNVYVDGITADEKTELAALFEKYAIDFDAAKLSAIRPKLVGRDDYRIFEPVLEPLGAKKYAARA
ncbi:MAG: glutamate synthase [Oscillospiraceae bacterium]|jgi:formylmethanofuran dehydrogenase subunit C|nr:glutamate synthase [Oscillospiraceae bacterium]